LDNRLNDIFLIINYKGAGMALIIVIKVIPSAPHQKCIKDTEGNIKCYLASPPEDGKANTELIKLLSKALRCAQNKIEILGGHTSRTKKIGIDLSISLQEVEEALGLERQNGIL
jgi:uncharacterized protein (TIGR00251 family)